MIEKGVAPNKKVALYIIKKVQEENNRKKEELLKAPRYFKELFERYPILKQFDLKEVITKNYVRQYFLKVAREQINKEVERKRLNFGEVIDVFWRCRFPIMLVALGWA